MDSRLGDEPRAHPVLRATLDQFRNLKVVGNLQPARVDQNKVRPVRDRVRESELVQPFQQDRLALVVRAPLFLKVAILERLFDSDGGRFLRGTVDTEHDARVGRRKGLYEVGRSDGPTDSPTCRRERFAGGPDRDRAVPKLVRERRDAEMLAPLEGQAVILFDKTL